MNIFIIVYKSNDYRNETLHRTYEDVNDALIQATDFASGNSFAIKKILKLNAFYNKLTELELGIVEGKLKLQEK